MGTAESSQVLPDRRDKASREQLLCRVRAEFEEMPSLRLTRGQAQRLFGLRPDVCDRVLAALISDHILYHDQDGRYRRYNDDEWRGAESPGPAIDRSRLRAS
jgi:hypothetical protein